MNCGEKSGKKLTREQDTGDSEPREPAEKPVSLHPVEFKEAVKGLFEVKPEKERRPEKDRRESKED